MDYWSREYCPENWDKAELFHGFLYGAHNGEMDVEGFMHSEYGEELGRRLQIRFKIEDENMGDEALSYYKSIGLNKEIFENDDYFTRWTLYTPLEQKENEKFPLIFWHHGGGNPIESSEVVSGLIEVAGRERVMVCMPQNTNWRNVERLLDTIEKHYPVDTERVYVVGFSQGGYQAHSAYMRMPERFAGAATSGSEMFRPFDCGGVEYSEADLEKVKSLTVPLIQFCGACEPSCFVPHNNWSPRRTPQADVLRGNPDTVRGLVKDNTKDPTGIFATDPSTGKTVFRMSKPFEPKADEDKRLWKLNVVNKRLWLMGCNPVNVRECLGYAETPEDELHHIMGIYADRESVSTYYGYKHYTLDYLNSDGVNIYRYIAVENSPHWPPLMFGELTWSFLKHFRRDSSGKLIYEEE